MSEALNPPFSYFGGKRRVAHLVWQYLGDVALYIEPFAGSLAVLLGRPWGHSHSVGVVNDVDAYIVNFWRAVKADPTGVLKWAKHLVSEADLVARNNWLVATAEERKKKLFGDPDYYDPKVAGWWVWGQSAWIGSGWARSIAGKKLPQIGLRGTQSDNIDLDYFDALSEKLKVVQVCNGDWKRCVSDAALACGNTVGVFLDPPYSGDMAKGLYVSEGDHISKKVRKWCIKNGDNPRVRIVLAGYLDEHHGKMPDGWQELKYKAGVSFSPKMAKEKAERGEGGNQENRHKECLWISPHCRKAARGLLGATVATTRIIGAK